MAKLKALGAGPIGFTDGKGSQHFIPLSWVVFDGGAVKLEPPAGALDDELAAAVGTWLTVLQKSEILKSEPEPPPKAEPVPPTEPVAMVIRAKSPGEIGNGIMVNIRNVRDSVSTPDTEIFDAVVTDSETFTQLTPASVKQRLGSTAGSSLVFVSSPPPPTKPKTGGYSFTAATDPADPATSDIADTATPAGVAFQLSTRAGGAEALLTKVTISEDPAHPNTFDLTATWSKPAEGIKAADFGPMFAYVVNVAQGAAPPGGAAPPLTAPAEGDYQLIGGSEDVAAAEAAVQLPSAP